MIELSLDILILTAIVFLTYKVARDKSRIRIRAFELQKGMTYYTEDGTREVVLSSPKISRNGTLLWRSEDENGHKMDNEFPLSAIFYLNP